MCAKVKVKGLHAIHSHLSTELSNQLSYTVSGLAVGDRGPLQSAPVANLCQDAPELRERCQGWFLLLVRKICFLDDGVRNQMVIFYL